MNKHDITELIKALGNIPAILAKAAPHDKAQIYSQLGPHLTYEPAKRLIRAETRLNPQWGLWIVSEGGLDHYAHVLNQRKPLVVG